VAQNYKNFNLIILFNIYLNIAGCFTQIKHENYHYYKPLKVKHFLT